MNQVIQGNTEQHLRITEVGRVRTACLLCALLAALAAGCWQAATVHFNYAGNWTALFCSGNTWTVPPELAASTYIFKHSKGYDGQFYRYIAHDPWLFKGWTQYVDIPVARYRRILVPGLAWMLALGQPEYIDLAYRLVILLCIFVGTYWLSSYAACCGRRPVWGLGFLLLPATLISIDRLTVDVALLALCAGFAWFVKRGFRRGAYVVLLTAPLVRETGVLLIAAACLHALISRGWRRMFLIATAVLPAVAWYSFIAAHVVAKSPAVESLFPAWLLKHPLTGAIMGIFPSEPAFSGSLRLLVGGLDSAAIVGLLMAAGLTIWGLRKGLPDPEGWAALAFMGLMIAVSTPGYWKDPYGYTRTLSPLLFFVGLKALSNASWVRLAPIFLMDFRLTVQLGRQVMGILRGVL